MTTQLPIHNAREISKEIVNTVQIGDTVKNGPSLYLLSIMLSVSELS